MASAAIEKSEDELRKELEELNRQQREITERLRDPRGLRRGGLTGAGPRNFAANGGGLSGAGPRNFATNGARQRGFIRPAERNDMEDQPPPKRRLSSAVVKIEDGEIIEDDSEAVKDTIVKESAIEEIPGNVNAVVNEKKPLNWSRRDNNQRPFRKDFDIPTEHVPRVLPKNEDPTLVSRNKRILGQLLGTLERFKKEDMQLSGSEAFMRRSDSLKRAEQRAREESEKLRQQERESIAEKRKRDLTLRARVAAKAEEKRLDLLFLRWSEHHKKLGNFIRTKTEPSIYYIFAKSKDEDATLVEQRKEKIFQEWKVTRREELNEYQKKINEQYVGNVDKELERWQNPRKGRKVNNDNMANLQETMDKELETHQLEHGPKTRKIPGGTHNVDDEEEDVEDINVVEDDMMDDVLVVDRKDEERVKGETTNNGSPRPESKDQ